MGDTSGIFHIYIIIVRTSGVCVAPFFFFFGVRCAQYKVHAQCSFAALAPHMPCMLLVQQFSQNCNLKTDSAACARYNVRVHPFHSEFDSRRYVGKMDLCMILGPKVGVLPSFVAKIVGNYY